MKRKIALILILLAFTGTAWGLTRTIRNLILFDEGVSIVIPLTGKYLTFGSDNLTFGADKLIF